MSGYEKVTQPGLIDFPTQSLVHGGMFYGNFPQVGHEYHHPLLQPGAEGNVYEAGMRYPSRDDYASANNFEDVKPNMMDMQANGGPRSGQMSVSHSRVPSSASTVDNSRKRKASSMDEYETVPGEAMHKTLSADEFDMLPIHKKPMIAQVHVQDPNGDYYDLSGQTSPYSQLVPTPTGSTGFPSYAGHGSSPRPSGHHYSTSNASQISLAAPSPHTPAFSPSFTTVKSEQSPGAPMTPLASASSPIKSLPKLVRTSTIQQSPPAVISTMSTGQTQNFNPYAMYPLKANLKLKGDLETMKLNWTAEEKEARRRLVEFKRTQANCTINAEFAPVAPQDRVSGSICISCIWWKEKNEFFVTSVDTIYLLEALVGVRFTVEEKNRIRRNLEGFRPMTVSKSKADSEDFFKVIMGFPHPKPRNIEKDVKVFPWKILSTALKKIISKYSASYSSTAAAILTPQARSYPHSDSHIDYYEAAPRMEYAPPVVPQYSMAGGEMGYMHGPGSAPAPGQGPMRMAGPPPPVTELQLQMPEYVPAYQVTGQYPYQTLSQIPQATMAMAPHPMTAPATRMPSWDYSNFVDENTINMAPHSAPPTAYPRGTMEMAEFFPAVHYQVN